MGVGDWLLTPEERENASTRIDAAHPGQGWTESNTVRPLVHGATYFAELYQRIEQLAEGDRLYFVDWRGDPDQLLTDDPRSEVEATLVRAAERGVEVRGLLWRSHWRRFGFGGQAHRYLGEALAEAGGQCLRDMRVRWRGSHHQKFVVLRHRDDPARDVAYVGGIDLCHTRRDDERHLGDRQRMRIATAYGPTPAWHDIQVAIEGPAVHDVETTFRERWEDSTPLTLNPGRLATSIAVGEEMVPLPLGEQWPPPPGTGGHEVVQILRTYPQILPKSFDFAPQGERSVMLGNAKAIGQAERLVYVEDQFLWSTEVGEHFARVLTDNPRLRLIVVLPMVPDKDGAFDEPPQWYGRKLALDPILAAGGDRVAVFGLTNEAGLPIYVHSKTCIIDRRWASVGSDNLNRRSWTSDSEISVAIIDDRGSVDDPAPEDSFPRQLLRRLVGEHLGCDEEEVPEDPDELFAAMVASAERLDRWYAGGARGGMRGRVWQHVEGRPVHLPGRWGRGHRKRHAARVSGRAGLIEERPPGRLRRLSPPELPRAQMLWAPSAYDRVFDPVGPIQGEAEVPDPDEVPVG